MLQNLKDKLTDNDEIMYKLKEFMMQTSEQTDSVKRGADGEEEMIGPNPRKLLKADLNDLMMGNLPSAENYEVSYMHRDVVNNVVCSAKLDFIVTCSVDGHLKFWRKAFHLIEFMRNFKAHIALMQAHNGLITGLALSKGHDLLCSVGIDKTLKIFDTLNCDLRTIIKLSFSPSCCEYLPQKDYDWQLIAIAEEKSGRLLIVDPQGSARHKLRLEQDEEIIDPQRQIGKDTETKKEEGKKDEGKKEENKKDEGKKEQAKKEEGKKEETMVIVETLTFHKHPIKFVRMNWEWGVCVSIDERACLDIWDPFTFDFPDKLSYSCKMETDFLTLLKSNSAPLGFSLSPKGNLLAVMLKDKTIRIFSLQTGRCLHYLSESIKDIIRIQESPSEALHAQLVLDEQDYERKINIEKDLEISKDFLHNPTVEFDESQSFAIYCSFHGVKIYSLKRHTVQRLLGRKEMERFVRVSLYQGKSMRNPASSSSAQEQRKGTDPLLICTAFKKNRFYLFSRRLPDIDTETGCVRDIVNERPNKEEVQAQSQPKITEKQNEVMLQTTLGDIHLLLFLQDCPKTCENFLKLVKKGYYNGMIFHRVIKGFMNQTGCPRGDGTGGESIWGGNFEDELRPEKYRFEKPYMVAMANRGPNTNGSQFFMTVIGCPWLDNKHTIFGRVIKGIETVCEINKLKTDKTDKPLLPVKIMNARVI